MRTDGQEHGALYWLGSGHDAEALRGRDDDRTAIGPPGAASDLVPERAEERHADGGSNRRTGDARHIAQDAGHRIRLYPV